ncbi:hypothetical protein Cus16_0745 [Curtobacterium sp. ER1/6]|nr:hypothetical protein Cus16_0745 [Curtobacterium sp. ER1/6]
MHDARGVEPSDGPVEVVDGRHAEAQVIEADAVGVEAVPGRGDRSEPERLPVEGEGAAAVGAPRVVADRRIVDLVAEVTSGGRAEQLLVERLAPRDVGHRESHVGEAPRLDDAVTRCLRRAHRKPAVSNTWRGSPWPVQRSRRRTPRRTSRTWSPQPVHEVLPHTGHWTDSHMPATVRSGLPERPAEAPPAPLTVRNTHSAPWASRNEPGSRHRTSGRCWFDVGSVVRRPLRTVSDADRVR